MKSKEDYNDYVIKNGKFIGRFEEMYQHLHDPWCHGDATDIPYDLVLYLINRYEICRREGDKILDIGCGKGAFTARLKKLRPKSKILAIDISPTAIKKATRKFEGIDFQVMDIQKEYKALGSFDLIVISGVMWYILPNFQKIMAHLVKGALKRNGYILMNSPFYKPEEQKYGNEIVQTPKDMINLINLEPVRTIETNRFKNHNAIVLFRKNKYE